MENEQLIQNIETEETIINTNSEENDKGKTKKEKIKEKVVKEKVVKEKVVKEKVIKVKETFEATCTHCSKVFKSNKLYEPHVKEQKCYKPDEITYCKICDITSPTRSEYIKHLLTMQHLNNIGFDKQERLETKVVNPVNILDPYLNDSDVNKINKTNLGEGITLVLDSGETKTIILKQNPNQNESNTEEKNGNPIIKPIARKLSPPPTPPEVIATERQQKILDVVIKLSSSNANIDSCNGKFYKILDEKMHIDDYKGFQMLINKLNISDIHKQSYIKLIGNYLRHLISMSSKGTTTYKDKDISQMVINLSY